MKSIWRLIVWHLRELMVRLDFQSACHSGHRVLFLDDAGRVRRGALFVTDNKREEYRLYVRYVGWDALTGQSAGRGTFLRRVDQHTLWTYGWEHEKADALLVAEALR